jgi:hypothetical protein
MTHAEYERYEKHIADFIAAEGLSFLSTGTEDRLDPAIHSEDYQGRESCDPWFSWHPCECCGSPLGGSREYLYARNEANEIVQFEICVDCVYYVNYGRLDDMTMMEVEASK